MPSGRTSAGEPAQKESSKPALPLSGYARPTDLCSGSGIKVSSIFREIRLGSSVNTGCQERRNTISPICPLELTRAPWLPPSRRDGFTAYLRPLRKIKWVVYAKEPFGGPKAVLAYLSRYTHRVAISNRRLIAADESGVSFKYKDYRVEGPDRYKVMTLATHEFIRRFLIHVLPKGVHRIRHYGLFANGNRNANIARARELLAMPPREIEQPETDATADPDQPRVLPQPCPCCAGRMIIIETFARGCQPKHRPTPAPPTIRIDTS